MFTYSNNNKSDINNDKELVITLGGLANPDLTNWYLSKDAIVYLSYKDEWFYKVKYIPFISLNGFFINVRREPRKN